MSPHPWWKRYFYSGMLRGTIWMTSVDHQISAPVQLFAVIIPRYSNQFRKDVTFPSQSNPPGEGQVEDGVSINLQLKMMFL